MKRILAHAEARKRAHADIDAAPDGWIAECREPGRTLDQSAAFHAICSDLAKAKVPWAGKPRDAAQWKILLVSGHAMATKQGAEMVPGIEGEWCNLRESTAAMGKKRLSSLIDYAEAWATEHGAAHELA